MISDEEKKAIEFLKVAKELKIVLSCSFWNNGEFEFNNTQKEQFDIILNLIERQSKEIEHLKRPKYIIDCKTNEITTLTNDFISKNKIKAKIEEYKKQIAKMEKDDVGIGFTLGKEWSDLKAKIEFGQSLLEKED